jgi:Tetracyclin repressor-like, C-terminal domain
VVEQIVEAAPLDVEDLSGYAARLADAYAQHPELVRLITWQRLERGADAPHPYATQSIRNNIHAIATAQADGLITDRFEARVLFALVIHIAALWGMSSPDVLAVVDLDDAKQRREIVHAAVASLLA